MKEIILGKYGEIALKGNNKNVFEDVMIRNLKRRLHDFGKFEISKAQSTVYINPVDVNVDIDEIMAKAQKVFGFAKLSKALIIEKQWDEIVKNAPAYLEDDLSMAKTFKVVAKRADKKFPFNSPKICMELGEVLLNEFPHLSVDVHNPDVTVTVEIREKNAFVHARALDGAGGMPVGTSGRGLLLLSGGIDSPVAGYMLAKRGMQISAIHFESPPYTSERARMKVESLASRMAEFCGNINFFCVPFTKIQEEIRRNCPEELFTIIMRRLMMDIAQRVADKMGLDCIITGESIGQVASQTMQAIKCTDIVATCPVFRPVIGMDKIEIIDISRKIDTYDISIEPYEDCCTVFTPKHPRTKPNLELVVNAQESYDFEPLIVEAIEATKPYVIKAQR